MHGTFWEYVQIGIVIYLVILVLKKTYREKDDWLSGKKKRPPLDFPEGLVANLTPYQRWLIEVIGIWILLGIALLALLLLASGYFS